MMMEDLEETKSRK